ncbi:hypothetical protein PFICI_11779 [Pestalotiopsis fici W106-1]|uniref:Uncharacterized protein n=1 Tax=Pestalotiopsis fici (strain W106-1 / CGMCC3.15140) TaxID=1229662 RepID=W3WTB7_PESFW|nr:uncharacterized protein PFICI_11779 [Pestalotiopsis fici W106-1]ETS76392.1 hypothetical protein PFICI_11779 [Pestalotiopsis fici W106-1]
MLSQLSILALALLLSFHGHGATASTTLEKVLIQRNLEHNDNPPLTESSMAPATAPPPPPHPPVSSFTASCDDAFCSQGSRYCYYWGGETSYEFGKGPVPGETQTILGACTVVTSTVPGSVVTQTITDSVGAVATVASTVPATVMVVEVWE